MLRVLLSSDDLDMQHFFDAVKGNYSSVELEAFLMSNKSSVNVDKHNIPVRHNKQVNKILNSFNKHLLVKTTQDIIDKFMSKGMHIYYLR